MPHQPRTLIRELWSDSNQVDLHHSSPPETSLREYPKVIAQVIRRTTADILSLIILTLLLGAIETPERIFLSSKAISILGIAVAIFIGFRNTQAIDRWWEARKLWGELVNSSRLWKDSLITYLDKETLHSDGHLLLTSQAALLWALNFELRNFARRDDLRLFHELLDKGQLSQSESTTRLISENMMRRVNSLHCAGKLDDWGRNQMVYNSSLITASIGGLQRIRNTPIPPPYDVFVRILSWIFGSQLILAFKADGSIITGAFLTAGFIFAERIGSYIEGPFDKDGSTFSIRQNELCHLVTDELTFKKSI